MFKKILLFLFIYIIYSLLAIHHSLSLNLSTEDAFTDIKSDYKYYNELKTLYELGAIFPDNDGRFNKNRLLHRDEFVGIAEEVSCIECIKPDVDLDLLTKYKVKPFFDVLNDNKYFYCVADSANNNFVKGYDIDFTCDNGVHENGKAPFCTDNNIKLEEALAVILRMSGILTYNEAEKVRQEIIDGKSFLELAVDIKPKNSDGSVYSFYPDFQKALNYELIEYDNKGNKKVYRLLEKTGNYLRPDKYITKEEFLHMAYIALKSSSCHKDLYYELALKMKIFDKICDDTKTNCSLSKLNDSSNTYDFTSDIGGVCDKGINNTTGYIWRFYNLNTGEDISKNGLYINNYTFLSTGVRKIYLRAIDNCGNIAQVYNMISIKNNNGVLNNLSASINAIPISGSSPLEVEFEAIIQGGNGPYTYTWDFGDGDKGFGKDIQHIFREPGVYEVILYVVDKDGLGAEASVLIKVGNNKDCTKDSDNDGVNNCNDLCPLIVGEINNSGCPVFGLRCGVGCSCKRGYLCSSQDINTCSTSGICQQQVPNLGECLDLKTNNGFIYSNAICISCPCKYEVDFRALLRSCDTIFPAIVSPDETIIYSKGDLFQILFKY